MLVYITDNIPGIVKPKFFYPISNSGAKVIEP